MIGDYWRSVLVCWKAGKKPTSYLTLMRFDPAASGTQYIKLDVD